MERLLEVYLTAFNEEGSIVQIVNECISEVENYTSNYSIIYVDNASTDNSKQIFEENFRENPKIEFTSFETNYGYSISVAKAIEMSTAEICIVMDADGQFPPVYIESFISRIKAGADLVLGARTKRVGNLRRRLGSYFFLFLARRIIKFNGPDLNVGMRATSSNFRNSLAGAQRGRLANPNIWYQANKENLLIEFVHLQPRNRKAGLTSLPWSSPIKLTLESVHELLKIKRAKYDVYFASTSK